MVTTSKDDLIILLHYIRDNTGIIIPEIDYNNFQRFIDKRLQVLKLNFTEYFEFIHHDEEERCICFSNSTINETYFFREQKQFDCVKNTIIPRIGEIKNDVRIWSVTCSTGEEAISLALMAEEYLYGERKITYEVYATDISEVALTTHSKGIYHKNSFRYDGKKYHYLLDKYGEIKGKDWHLHDSIKKKIAIKRLNLFQDNFLLLPDNFSLIFFRNTLIYINKQAQHEILTKVAEKLEDKGYLFLGASETYLLDHPQFELKECNGMYFYQKNINTTSPMVNIGVTLKNTAAMVETLNTTNENTIPIKEEIPIETDDTTGIFDKIMYSAAKKWEHENREPVTNDALVEKLSARLLDILHYLNQSDFEQALTAISEIEDATYNNEILAYLRGITRFYQENKDKALLYFKKAMNYNPYFWPASFYIAKILLDSDKARAYNELKKCKKIIKMSLEQDHIAYTFLLEGFNAKYFYDMCEKLMQKLEKQLHRGQ